MAKWFLTTDCGFLVHYHENSISLWFDSRSVTQGQWEISAMGTVREATIWVVFNCTLSVRTPIWKEGMVNRESKSKYSSMSSPESMNQSLNKFKELTTVQLQKKIILQKSGIVSTTAAAKSRQSCLTLCNPIDGSPTGSSVPGILQARILESVAISFSNAWKWKVKVKSLIRVRPLVTP